MQDTKPTLDVRLDNSSDITELFDKKRALNRNIALFMALVVSTILLVTDTTPRKRSNADDKVLPQDYSELLEMENLASLDEFERQFKHSA